MEVIEVSGEVGKWVVIVKNKVIASSDNLKEILEIAEKYPSEEVLITKIPYPGLSFY
ncbi:MAG: DUF5678 domain-containing protein [Candidatus Thermoplasmatota archaeon]|nr:DUF5678 domain-containing protein [Candidatus Thermoplasmatota archaeon]